MAILEIAQLDLDSLQPQIPSEFNPALGGQFPGAS
jgi:hypothetical protein